MNNIPPFDISDSKAAGTLMFLSGAVALMGIITAETLYPDYSTRQDISDLGSTRPPDPVILEPSATIFNSTMIITGALILIATYFVHKRYSRRVLTLPLTVFGTGVFGVGVFPGNVVPWHGLFAMVTFVSGGITAVLSSRVVTEPFRYICLLFGGISLMVLLSAIILQERSPLMVLGFGGVERWVVYPLLMWITGFGGYLLGDANTRD